MVAEIMEGKLFLSKFVNTIILLYLGIICNLLLRNNLFCCLSTARCFLIFSIHSCLFLNLSEVNRFKSLKKNASPTFLLETSPAFKLVCTIIGICLKRRCIETGQRCFAEYHPTQHTQPNVSLLNAQCSLLQEQLYLSSYHV